MGEIIYRDEEEIENIREECKKRSMKELFKEFDK